MQQSCTYIYLAIPINSLEDPPSEDQVRTYAFQYIRLIKHCQILINFVIKAMINYKPFSEVQKSHL